MIGDSVIGVIAQRLVRRVCPECGVMVEATEDDKRELGLKDNSEKLMIKKARHCECVRCGGTGYYGRIGVYEIMPVNRELKRAINKGENADALEQIALKNGMKTLRMSVIDYVLKGITTVDEVRRVTYEND